MDTCVDCDVPAHVNCGEIPAPEVLSLCDPNAKPCLFDIKNDPCEYRDLSDVSPEVAAHLKEMILIHARRARKPVNKPPDPALDPKFHDGVWGVVVS